MGFTDEDEYTVEAAKLIIEKDKASVGMLQRAFNIGFNRATRIMETLEEYGVVSGENFFKSRKVLMSSEEFKGLLCRIERNEELHQNTESKQFTQCEKVNMYNNQYDYMTGEDFEVFVAQILRRIGFTNIQLTKGSGDQGVDIIAERDGIKYAIQCKRYSQPVGNKAVQEVFAGKVFYHCHIGVVVTNNYFTQSAKDLARENGIVLWDRNFLQNIINSKKEYFEFAHERKEEISKDELTKTLKEMAIKISNVFNSFQINAPIVNIDYGKSETVFWIQPPQGVRIKTILSYKQEIEFELRMSIQIRVISEKGQIGIFVSSNELSKYARKNNNETEENKNSTENEILREYNENRGKDELRILDVEEKIVAIEDGQISKALYQYLENASRIAIDMFLRDGDGNPYTEDMIKNVEKPIILYNVKLVKLTNCDLQFVYYCKMNKNYKNTSSYYKSVEVYKKNGKIFNNDLFNISVFYNIDNITMEGNKIKIKSIPEVNIMYDNMESIKCLEDIDEYDKQMGYKYLVSENFFPMKMDNIKIFS